ncbi:MAG TPA: branched-chain amino acid transaminase [Blastocatellia bacterium]|nr:branched-chain amino acid transaminase [Blastocatellia bacterium]
MPSPEITKKIWHNGKFINWEDASIHVMSHVVHYGSSVFEGIRCYSTAKGPAIFRLDAHLDRLMNSCHIYRMDIEFTVSQLKEACVELLKINEMKECYIRPVVFRGYGTFGVNPFPAPIETYIACYPWGKYLGPEAVEKGVDACVSSWARMAPNTFPAMSKSGANYMNSQLIKMEAITNGYVEGIALDHNGYVSEGSGENIFIVKNGHIQTPPVHAAILPGITRDSVMEIARDNGYKVVENQIPREMLYVADEVFFSGTAAEITPIRTIDRIKVGNGGRGPITEQIQKQYFAATKGEIEDERGWLTFVK